MERKLAWFPFTTAQVEIALGLAGLGATAASLLEVPGPTVALGTAGLLILTFLVGVAAAAVMLVIPKNPELTIDNNHNDGDQNQIQGFANDIYQKINDKL